MRRRAPSGGPGEARRASRCPVGRPGGPAGADRLRPALRASASTLAASSGRRPARCGRVSSRGPTSRAGPLSASAPASRARDSAARRAARPARPDSPLPSGRSRSARPPIRRVGRAPAGASAARPAPARSPSGRHPQGDNRTCHHSDDMIEGRRGAAHRRNTEKLPRLIGGVRNSDAHRSVPRARPPHTAVPGCERQSAPVVRESGGRLSVRARASSTGRRARAPPAGGRPGRVRHRSRTQHPRRPVGNPPHGCRPAARPAQRAATGRAPSRRLTGHHPTRPRRSPGGRTAPPAARTCRRPSQHCRRRSRTHADQQSSPLSSQGSAAPSTADGPREGTLPSRGRAVRPAHEKPVDPLPET